MDAIPYTQGMVITKACIVEGMPIARYHSGDICAGPSVSSSGLRKIFNESPAHYWVESPLNPDRIEPKESAALVLGRATHHLALGEDDYSKLFVVRPDHWDSWRTKEAKTWRGEQQLAGKTVLDASDVESIRGMCAVLARHPLIQAGILNGKIERSIFWRDQETGVWLKIRPDATPTDSGDFADLKTTNSVHAADLQKTIAEFGYHQQGALVGEGCKEVLGFPMTSFSLVFTEKTPPHCARVVTLKGSDLARGAQQNRAALRTFAECLKTGEWPGPGGVQSDAEFMELPAWAQSRIDDKLKGMAA